MQVRPVDGLSSEVVDKELQGVNEALDDISTKEWDNVRYYLFTFLRAVEAGAIAEIELDNKEGHTARFEVHAEVLESDVI